MNSKYFILAFAFIFLIGIVSGYQADVDVQLKFRCTLNDAIPSAAATYNFTLSYPNGTTVLNETAISLGNGLFYYNVHLPIGNYKSDEFCSDGTYSYSNTEYYEFSAIGFTQSTSQSIGSAIFLFLMLALTFIFGWIGFKLSESKTLWLMGIFFLFLSMLFIVYDVWLGYEYHRSFTGLSSSAMPETIFYIFLFLLGSGLLASLGLLFTRWKELARYIKNEITKKKEDEEFDKDFE